MHCMRKRRIKDAQSSLNVQLMYGNENWQKKRQNAVLNKYTLQLYHALSEPPFIVDKYK